MPRERYRIGDLTLDVDAVSLRRDGASGSAEISLPKLSFDLLVALVRRAPSVVSGDDLISLVWPGVAVSDETLTQRVALLRRALGEDAKEPRYLRAVRGRGYQLVPEAVPLGEPAIEPPVERMRTRPRLALGVLALLGLAALALLFLASRRSARPGSEASASKTSVATRAATVPELLDRAGSYLRQQQEKDNELAIELYRRALVAEPENAQALAGLSLALSQRATKFNRRDEESAEALLLARQALDLDGQLGLAHHALGLALDARGYVKESIKAYRRAAELEREPGAALASAAHLLQVSGQLAEALHANLRAADSPAGREGSPYLEVQIGATLALLGFDTPATVWFERALELRPDNVFAALAYARFHLSRHRFREADALARQALARGVRRPELEEIRGTAALLEGKRDEARRRFEKALAIAPGYLRARTRLFLLDAEDPARASGLADRQASLVVEIRDGWAFGDEWPDSRLDVALLEANATSGPGAGNEALAALDGAIERGYRDAGWLEVEPAFATLRRHPAFARRLESIRLQVDAERQRVLESSWLPPSFLEPWSGKAASK